jgi:hypothetical protein
VIGSPSLSWQAPSVVRVVALLSDDPFLLVRYRLLTWMRTIPGPDDMPPS